MRMRRLFALLIPLACAALFIRLGFWQLERGRERAEINEGLSARLTEAPMPFDALPADTLAQRWRRVTLAGRFRYDLEQVQAARTNGGSPGVHLLTPLQREGNDTLVIVSRGWVYSADAASANLARWRESEQVELSGYALPWPPEGTPAPPDRPPPRSAPTPQVGQSGGPGIEARRPGLARSCGNDVRFRRARRLRSTPARVAGDRCRAAPVVCAAVVRVRDDRGDRRGLLVQGDETGGVIRRAPYCRDTR